MPVTCSKCGRGVEPNRPVDCQDPQCPYKTSGAEDEASGGDFDDFFEIAEDAPASTPPTPDPSPPTPSSDDTLDDSLLGDLDFPADEPPAPQEMESPSPPKPSAPPVEPPSEPEISAPSSDIPDEDPDDLFGDVDGFIGGESEQPVKATPASESGEKVEYTDSLDSDFEDLFEEDFEVESSAPTEEPSPSPAPSDGASSSADLSEQESELEELFSEPTDSAQYEESDLESSLMEGDDDLGEKVTIFTRLKKPLMWGMPIVGLAVVLGLAGFAIFGPEKKVPDQLMWIRNLYTGAPSKKEQASLARRAENLAKAFKEDNYLAYRNAEKEIQAIITQAPMVAEARGYLALSILLALHDQTPEKKTIRQAKEKLGEESQAEPHRLGRAYLMIKERKFGTAEKLLVGIASPLADLIRGEQAYAKGNFKKATAYFKKVEDFDRARYRLAQISLTSDRLQEAKDILQELAKSDHPHLPSKFLLYEINPNKQLLLEKITADLDRYSSVMSPYTRGKAYFLLYQASNHELEHLQHAVKNDPTNSRYVFLLGKRFLALNDLKNAVAHLRTAVQLEPENPQIATSLGEALRLSENLDEALKVLEGTVAEHPENKETLFQLALCQQAKGEEEKARETANILLTKFPTHAQSQILMGELSLADGKLKASENYFRKAMQYNPSLPGAYKGLGQTNFRKKKFKESRSMFLIAKRLAPKDLELLNNLAQTYWALKQASRAVSTLDEILKLNPDNLSALSLSATIARASRQYETARDRLERLIKLEPKVVDHKTRLAEVYIEENKPKKALLALSPAVNVQNDHYFVRYLMGIAHRMLENHEESISQLTKSARLNPKHALTYLELARSSDANGNLGASLRNLEQLLELSPKNLDGLILAAKTYTHIGDNPKALSYYKRAVPLSPKDWKLLVELGDSYFLNKNSKHAFKLIRCGKRT